MAVGVCLLLLLLSFRCLQCLGNFSSPNFDLLNGQSSHTGTIYFNNPHLLKDKRRGFLRDGGKSMGLPKQAQLESEVEVEAIGGVYIQEEAKIIASHLRKISNEEVGVTAMQEILDSLPFATVVPNEEELVEEMSSRLESKIADYVDIVQRNKEGVEELYWLHSRIPVSHVLPCCNLDDSLLKYQEHFGTKVSLTHTCDIDSPRLDFNSFSPGQNLTELFDKNLKQHPTIKWQYFISSDGIHSEYPAHNFGSRTSCKMADETRHRDINLATIQPHQKRMVIVIDHGNSMSPNQLIIAKAVAKHILATLSYQDKVGLIGLSGEPLYPRSDDCLPRKMASATYEAKFHFSRFIDALTKSKDATNHTLGFKKAFEMIQNSFQVDENEPIPGEALIIYVSRGLLSSLADGKVILETIAEENRRNGYRVIINTYAVIDDDKRIMYEKEFLQDVADQNFKKYNVNVKIDAGRKIKKGITMAINSTQNLTFTVGKFYSVLNSTSESQPHFSLPYWDSVGKGLVVSITKACTNSNRVIGVVGLDLHLSDLVEDIIYHTQGGNSYAFMIDKSGYTIMHPSFSHPSFATEQPMHTDILHLESRSGFHLIREDMLINLSGRETLVMEIPDNHTEQQGHQIKVKYTWKRVPNTPYIICLVTAETYAEMRSPKTASVPLKADLVYHRMDLVPSPNMCQHFRQLATIEFSALFLSAGSFVSPFEYLTQEETKRNVQSYMAYLSDGTKLIANPGLKSFMRSDVAALFRITAEWKERFLNSPLSKYIIRRYVATPSGAFQIFPGCVIDRTYDPTKRGWYLRAMEYPGHVVITAPYLDVGGAGYIVTVSHTVYEGKPAAMHSSTDAVVAVMAVDFTLGYFYKLLLDVMPVCDDDRIMCFILDDKGYLIAHPGLIEPNGKGPVEQQHITHKEPLVANDILNHKGFVKKKVCNSFSDRTIQRFYQFNTSLGGVLTNLVHGEHCSKYQITAIPGTNVFLGIVNQTCDMATAFCPCSMLDRLCLNCHRMEQSDCECPCECPLQMNLCTAEPLREEDANPSCPHFPEDLHLFEVDPALLEPLNPCVESNCPSHLSQSDCFGIMGCEWCQVDMDGHTPLKHPFCTEHRKCFGGILGARTPYADEVIGLPVEDFLTFKSTPVGPVAGGIMGCFLVMALAVYCYRHHVHRTSHQYISTVTDTGIRMSQLNNETDDVEPHEEFSGVGHSNVILATFENSANISPYRVNTGYRRPPGGDSDHGYSTMTPHEDSEYMPYIEPLILGKDRYRPAQSMASSSRTSSPIPHPLSPAPSHPSPSFSSSMHSSTTNDQPLIFDLSQTVLPETRAGHHILAPVQVHMVDSH